MSLKQKMTSVADGIKNNPTLTPKDQLGYCGGIFGNCMGQDSVGTYGEKFSLNFVGISSDDIQLKDNIVEVFGFITAPIAGALYDYDRGGKKMTFVRMMIGLMPIPFAIASMLLFINPSGEHTFRFIWTVIFSLIFSISDTFFDTAMNTLGLRMAPNPKDRKNFFTLTSWASTLGSMLPGWIIPIFVGMAKTNSQKQWTYFFIALFFCVLGFFSMESCYVYVKDRPVVSLGARKENDERIRWNKDIILAILHNRPFMVTQFSLLFDVIRQVTYKFLPFLYEDTFGDYKMKAIIDAVSGALSYVGLAAVPFVGNKVSARNILAGGYGYTAFFYLIMSMFDIGFKVDKIRKYRYLIGALIGLAGMPNAAQGAARKIIVADSTDYMEWYSATHYGVPMRSDGILSAAQSVFGKVIALAKANAFGIALRMTKYQESNSDTEITITQTPETLKRIFMVVTLCGLVGNLASAVTFLFDNYTGKRKERINSELNEIRQNSRAGGDTVAIEKNQTENNG